ncbi:MAG TPA: tetratricopeptide repeat protein, partial [Bacteroidota bacterium]|nr:tetratricopeptide repeat protein [Bacteroidota bacterium]
AGLTGLLADSLFSMNLSTVPVAMMFWIFLGVGAGRLVDPNFKSVTFKLPAVASKMRFAPFVLVTALVGLMIPRIVGQHISGRELLAGLYLRYEGKNSEAVRTFFLSAEQHPHPPEADFYLAGALADREDYATALRHVNKVLDEYPYYPKIRMIGALSQFSLGDTTAALRSVHEELAIENSPQVCSFAAEISRLAGRKSDEYRFLTLQLRKNCESGTKDHAADAIDRIGTLSGELHKQDSCGMLLDTLLSKFPTDAYILVSLGRAYVDVNEVEKARQCLYSVRKIGVTDEQTRAQITSLEARIDSVGR